MTALIISFFSKITIDQTLTLIFYKSFLDIHKFSFLPNYFSFYSNCIFLSLLCVIPNFVLPNFCILFKNVSSSTSHKKNSVFTFYVFTSFRLYVRLYKNLRKFFLTHSFMNRFLWKFIWILILWIRKYFILISMNSKDIKGHKRSSVFPGI